MVKPRSLGARATEDLLLLLLLFCRVQNLPAVNYVVDVVERIPR